ncbi:ThiF family adenylyltransferase [Paenibacillus sp. N1-5-1-14]|uniref:ThiF family adenylyltransferase n=1 Tax=Paenibacillus radicibacter TaxID=2972488 RepID=UPI00215947E5|nr:ThiF family adenylyltransferase [Paenibacillus radicibacter]MCR8643677.1 ThiF family adenylyltransferase [Paenibacillus radicibacter]
MEIPSRYSRHTRFQPIGEAGQQQLINSRVAIVGLGALGTVLANHMVRSGVGFIRIIDRDFVEESNLQRQILYDEEDANLHTPKAIAAASKLRLINSLVEIEPHIADLNSANAEQLLSNVDLILDGTDNFTVRFLINDVAIKHQIPWIYGGAVSSRGVSYTIIPDQTPCLRCLFHSAPALGTTDTCDTAGVIGTIIHVVASFQATEAMKLLIGDRDHLQGRMNQWDLWENHYSSIDVSKARKVDCPACGKHDYEYLDAVLDEEWIQTLCGRDSVQIHPVQATSLSLEQLEQKLQALGDTTRNRFLLKFAPSAHIRMMIFPDGRVMIQGTDDIVQAKTLYAKYLGM